jgi:high-affinity iron transporter
VKINLKNFFTVTGYFLILVAAGVLTYGIHEYQEVGILPGEDSLAFNVSSSISTDTWFGALAKGIFNFSPETSWLQAIGWIAYVAFAIWIFNRKVPVASATKVEVPLKQKA